MKKNSSYSEILRHENEITKLKLQAEFGMQLNGNSDLNPAIENIWLNHILEYERALVGGKKITIGEMLDNPSCKHVNEITEHEIPEKLNELMDLLRTKNIVIESIDGIEDREMYRFITQELFLEETDIDLPKNMITCFIYEEFYPNDTCDIRRHSEDFINLFVKKDNDYYENLLTSGKDGEENQVKSENLKRKLRLFRDAFDEIRMDEFEIESVNIVDEQKADVVFDYKISVLPPHSNTFQLISGTGRFDFINIYDCWVIDEIVMKGVV